MSIAMTGHLGIKQEASFGVEATPPTVFGEFKSESMAMDNNLIMPDYIGGTVGRKRILPGPISNEGDLVFDLMPEDLMGWVLKGIFGQVSTTSPVAGVYQHVFTPRSGLTLPSFTVQTDREAGCENHIGTRFGSFNLGISPEELLECSVGMISQYPKEATPASPTYSTLDPWTAFDASVTFNSVLNTDFETIDFAISNDLQAVPTLNNQRYAGKVSVLAFDVSGNMTLEFDSMDLVRRMWGNSVATQPQNCLTGNDLTITITSQCQEIGSTGYYYAITFEFFDIFISTAPHNLSGAKDRIMIDVAWTARYSAADANVMRVTLQNSQTGYPDP